MSNICRKAAILGEAVSADEQIVGKRHWKLKYTNLGRSTLLKMYHNGLIREHEDSGFQTLWTLSEEAYSLLEYSELQEMEEREAVFIDNHRSLLEDLAEEDDEFVAGTHDLIGQRLTDAKDFGYIERVEKRVGRGDVWETTGRASMVTEVLA